MEQHPPLLHLLHPEQHPGAQAHLRGCARCRVELRIYQDSFGEAPPPSPPPAAPALRYRVLTSLGVGGMGEVLRAFDPTLGREVAMKVIHPGAAEARRRRFLAEAQATAQLQHPGIIPIYDQGRLPDGRPYYIMPEVQGRTLTEVIAEVHDAARAGWWAPSATGWTLRRLVEAFARVCEAVAYAHERGVLHRDLKPANLMIGRFGEILVLDWGLARALPPDEDEGAAGARVSTIRAETTWAGRVSGTPAYMPPEQASGQDLDVRADVYALGAVLYEILCGLPPYRGAQAADVLQQVRAGPPPPPQSRLRPGSPRIPDELAQACAAAMARERDQRPASATALADAARAWLEGVQRREKALAVVQEAAARRPRIALLRQRATERRLAAEALLAEVQSWEPEARKAPAWEAEDEARELDRAADRLAVEEEHLLQAALSHDPDLQEAHAALAGLYRDRHAAAEEARDEDAAARAEFPLRTHALALPAGSAERASALGYLQGDGRLTLLTDPPGAAVTLLRYERERRRLVARPARELGTTPLRDVVLPYGSYMLEIQAPDRPPVRYPVAVGRGEEWHGRPPGAAEPLPVYLPLPGEIGPDEVYVPAGWFRSGGDPNAYFCLPARRRWLGAYAVQRFPVTNRQFLAFLNALVAAGREAEALRAAPRERASGEEQQGTLIWGRDAEGRFYLRPDGDGDVWEPDWPVMMVDWHSATAYAGWLAAETGLPWRLPSEWEWEKAARGVDGRFYPCGDVLDPTWCWIRESHPGRSMPAPVDSCPLDVSPYGARGMAGNMSDWTDSFMDEHADPPVGVYRGGSWSLNARAARSADRGGRVRNGRYSTLGFRLVRGISSPGV